MRVIDIIQGTSVDGPGLRTSVYFAGCDHGCPGCHNPQSWDHSAGREMSAEEIMKVVEENGFNVTFSGGDPLYQIDEIIPLATEIRRRGYNVWCYTGFTLEEIQQSERLSRILKVIDVLVDGPFVMAERDTTLRFRGSRNQRIIHLTDGIPDKSVGCTE